MSTDSCHEPMYDDGGQSGGCRHYAGNEAATGTVRTPLTTQSVNQPANQLALHNTKLAAMLCCTMPSPSPSPHARHVKSPRSNLCLAQPNALPLRLGFEGAEPCTRARSSTRDITCKNNYDDCYFMASSCRSLGATLPKGSFDPTHARPAESQSQSQPGRLREGPLYTLFCSEYPLYQTTRTRPGTWDRIRSGWLPRLSPSDCQTAARCTSMAEVPCQVRAENY